MFWGIFKTYDCGKPAIKSFILLQRHFYLSLKTQKFRVGRDFHLQTTLPCKHLK